MRRDGDNSERCRAVGGRRACEKNGGVGGVGEAAEGAPAVADRRSGAIIAPDLAVPPASARTDVPLRSVSAKALYDVTDCASIDFNME